MVPSMRRKFSPWIITILPLGMGDPRTVKSTSFRMHFLVLALCGYILTQSYLASLSGILTKPRSSSEMQTLEELEESDYPLYGLQTIRLQLMESNPKLYKHFKEVSMNEYFEMFDQVIAGRKKVATHAAMTQILFINTTSIDMNFHVIPEKIGFYSISMLLPETSLILPTFDKLISIAVENGLFDYWIMQQLKEGREKNLISGVFFLLVIGLVISSLTFIGELVVGSKNVPPHQRHLKALRLRRIQ
ncbi:uncharacterized protein LOC107269638 [Cephus cinctus]|uniref:Uncharacterized protein LOC107269638 n=1 Tax=Cephus cinctus TaxID=211228 RepID=A0AAJ7W214_CEPCN|nr:uncharacterized protein LOC107269638 [Cephus cinctus]